MYTVNTVTNFRRTRKFWFIASYIVFCICLLVLPGSFINITLSVQLGSWRLSIVDGFFLFLILKIFTFKVEDRYTYQAVNKILVIGYFLLLYGLVISFFRGINTYDLGIELRYFLGFFAGLGFTKIIYSIKQKERLLLLSFLCIALLVFSLFLHILRATEILTDHMITYKSMERVTDIQAFSLYALALLLMNNVVNLKYYNKRVNYMIPIIIFMQMIFYLLSGIRSFLIVTLVFWVAVVFSVRKNNNLIVQMFIISIPILILFYSLDYFRQNDMFLFFNTSFTRLEYFLLEQSRDLMSTNRMVELTETLRELSPVDFLFGRGIGGLVNDYLGWTIRGVHRGIHIAIVNWIIKFGLIGVLIVVILIIITIRGIFLKLKDWDMKNISVRLSSIMILTWLSLQLLSGGWDRWIFFILAINIVEITRYFSMRKNHVRI
ncbi:MAG: hypothetical protein H8D45_19355 [Bacteroidetes bacterium]|nr:hypothetical protein [Bacteroidota bacterium]